MFYDYLTDESAQGLVEYALVISLIALAAIAAMKTLGKKSSATIKDAGSYLK